MFGGCGVGDGVGCCSLFCQLLVLGDYHCIGYEVGLEEASIVVVVLGPERRGWGNLYCRCRLVHIICHVFPRLICVLQ